MQENSTMFAKCDTMEEKESHDKLVHLAVSEILSLSENQLQEVIRRYMLSCRLTIWKKDKNGKWYCPKNQHRIWRFFREDLFGWINWFLPEKKR